MHGLDLFVMVDKEYKKLPCEYDHFIIIIHNFISDVEPPQLKPQQNRTPVLHHHRW